MHKAPGFSANGPFCLELAPGNSEFSSGAGRQSHSCCENLRFLYLLWSLKKSASFLPFPL